MKKEIEKVRDALEEPLRKAGYALAEVCLVHGKDGLVLRLAVDRDEPISLDDIVVVSNLINPLLDAADPIAGPYTLDVSNLGAEKPLKLLSLPHHLHESVELHLLTPYEGANLLKGELLEVTPERITLLLVAKGRKKKVSVLSANVDRARLASSF